MRADYENRLFEELAAIRAALEALLELERARDDEQREAVKRAEESAALTKNIRKRAFLDQGGAK